MQRITFDRTWPLHGTAASRSLERHAAADLPAHALMQRAGLAVARLALAIAPHVRTIWIPCGPGNNGGDGFEAAMHLRTWGKDVAVSWAGDEGTAPPDALAALQSARRAGVNFTSEAPAQFDLAIDALLGLGSGRPLTGSMRDWADRMSVGGAPVLAVDVPSGLNSDTGTGEAVRASHTLSLLTLKPGLFTAFGRDFAGDVWFDDLGVSASTQPTTANLAGKPQSAPRPHASHKGVYGDVAVIGGAHGMTGAALLAGTAALHAGAGRVMVGLLGDPIAVDTSQPELMIRPWDSLALDAMTVACGCGGGDAIRAVLPKIFGSSRSLVVDADALNAIAADTQLLALLRARAMRGHATVLTPHPLEAARLLGTSSHDVQADRLAATLRLVDITACTVVLKGSGTIVAAPDRVPAINPTGNALLATGGTGDVLAGLIAARLATTRDGFDAAVASVYEHGALADSWPRDRALTAGALARALQARA